MPVRTPRQSDAIFTTKTRALAGLRVLFTSDVHGNLLGYDYFTDRPDPAVGLSRTASLIDQLKQTPRTCLLLDGGDSLQGSPLTDWAAQTFATDASFANPVITTMNAMGYDAAGLGNHDFGFGLGFLKAAMTQADFPLLCANIRETANMDRPFAPPTAILTRRLTSGEAEPLEIRIGLFSVLPPQVIDWEASKLRGHVTACSIAEAASASVRALKAEGADLIIALSHAGISEAEDIEENASVVVAGLADVDVVLCGHTHQVFPGPHFGTTSKVDPVQGSLCGKPSVMPGFAGSHVGLIDLDLVHKEGRWQIEKFASQAVATVSGENSVDESPKLVSLLSDAHRETLAFIRRPVGVIPDGLNSFFSAVHDDQALRLVAEAQRRFVCDALQQTGDLQHPVLSASAPLKAGGRGGAFHYTDVPAGEISIAGISDLYCFPNEIAAVRITGAQLRDWLEMAAGRYRQIIPGQQDQALVCPNFPAFNADVVHGLTYQIDLTQPARFSARGSLLNEAYARIRDLRYQGSPVDADKVFIVATNNYRAHGGGQFPWLKEAEKISLPLREIRAILADHIVQGQDLYGVFSPAWTFAPISGASAVFETSPRAQGQCDMLQRLCLSVPDLADNGAFQLRVHF